MNRFISLATIGVLSVSFSIAHASVVVDDKPTMQDVQTAVNAGDYESAIADARAVTAAQPNNANAWFMLGYALHANGDLEEAAKIHKKAAGFPQTAPLATYNLGCALALLGDADGAFDALNKSVLLGVRDETQYKHDADLRSLHGDDRWDGLLATIEDLRTNPPEQWLMFWAGSWDCYARSGAKVGTNSFTKRLGGKVLHEQWAPTNGAPGESWNYYDPASNVWRQTWLESDGSVTHFEGAFKDGGVFFDGKRAGTNGAVSHVTMFVRPIGDQGWVRQTGENVLPDGSTSPAYDLVYVPTGKPFDPSDVDW